MQKILATIAKELLLLIRDRAGLLVLFVMPAILVVVITLVQENVLALSGQRPTEILLLDQDGGIFAATLRAALEAGQLKIAADSPKQPGDFQKLIEGGRYQAGICIPAGISQRLQNAMAARLAGGQSSPPPSNPASLTVLFDPAAMAAICSLARMPARKPASRPGGWQCLSGVRPRWSRQWGWR